MNGRKHRSKSIEARVQIIEAMQARNAERQRELERREEQLRRRTEEFIQKQVDVNEKSRGMVSALDVIRDESPKDQKEIVDAFQKPYVILANNPFPSETTGDTHKDLVKIFSVIEGRDEQFQRFFASTMQSAANVMKFNDFLARIRNDKRLAAIMRECVQAKSWSEIESCVVLPFQNACRYQLLISAIKSDLLKKKDLTKPGPGHVEQLNLIDELLEKIESSELQIKRELDHINNHKDTLVLLNEAYHYLIDIERRSEVKNSVYSSPTGLSMLDLLAQAKFFIPVVSAKVASNQPGFIEEVRGVLDTLELLRPALVQLIEVEQGAYITQGYNMLNRVVDRFVSEDMAYDPLSGDARAMMLAVIDDLAFRLKEIEAREQGNLKADDEIVTQLKVLNSSLQAMCSMPVMQDLGFKSENNLGVDVLHQQAALFIRELIRKCSSGDIDTKLYMDTLCHLLKPLDEAATQSLSAQPSSYLGWIFSGVTSYAGSFFTKAEEDPRAIFKQQYAKLEDTVRVLVLQKMNEAASKNSVKL